MKREERKRGPGRPTAKFMPEPIPDTPENVMAALLRTSPKPESEGDLLRDQEPE